MYELSEVKKNPDTLKQYIQDYYTVCSECFNLQTAIGKLDEKIASLGNAAVITTSEDTTRQEHISSQMEKHVGFMSSLGGVLFGLIPGGIIGFIIACMNDDFTAAGDGVGVRIYTLIGAVVGAIIAFLYYSITSKIRNNKLARELNQEKIREHNRVMEEHNKAVQADMERVENENRQKEVLIQKRDEMEAARQNSVNLLKSLCEPIFEKYRFDVIAVSQFCEYLASGRCTSLEGPDGAYNLYENEVRLDRIIDRLDVIIENLEAIRQNQYMLYKAMLEGHQLMENMSRSISAIQRNTEETAANTAIAAYYASVSANNTEIMSRYGINTY
ncbi:hypothetical protein SAMN02910368_00202 [Lachnospiraceae bacterium G11]|nr:hypothetical protein SAMN02910368_00202 [Lachnospiraceae bacterium G11]